MNVKELKEKIDAALKNTLNANDQKKIDDIFVEAGVPLTDEQKRRNAELDPPHNTQSTDFEQPLPTAAENKRRVEEAEAKQAAEAQAKRDANPTVGKDDSSNPRGGVKTATKTSKR